MRLTIHLNLITKFMPSKKTGIFMNSSTTLRFLQKSLIGLGIIASSAWLLWWAANLV